MKQILKLSVVLITLLLVTSCNTSEDIESEITAINPEYTDFTPPIWLQGNWTIDNDFLVGFRVLDNNVVAVTTSRIEKNYQELILNARLGELEVEVEQTIEDGQYEIYVNLPNERAKFRFKKLDNDRVWVGIQLYYINTRQTVNSTSILKAL